MSLAISLSDTGYRPPREAVELGRSEFAPIVAMCVLPTGPEHVG
ncbi:MULTISPECIES: hypothetical protein [unclassified Bradyrhizobium]|nr:MULTISPECIES: hypothetical protein [unclassified Bradyrhizobium]